MNVFGVTDFRDEFYVKTLRRWIVIKSLCKDSKFKEGVVLEKAAFVDFLLCNQKVMQRFLVNFGKAQQALNLDELLYKDNIEFGSVQEVSDFSKTCSLLVKKNYIKFKKTDGEIILLPAETEPPDEAILIKRWRSEINLLLPLLGKSVNVLHNSVLKESNGN
jgi:hypothetical protein